MIKTIKVEMLGGLSVWADGEPVLDGSAKINKPWQVFCFLVLNRTAPCSASRLIDALWADEELTDPANVLKNTVYALRREFKGAATPKQSPILFENGGYICNSAINFEVDAEIFEQIIKKAAGEGEQKTETLMRAVEMYTNEFLPQLEAEAWVMPLALYYKQLFSSSVQQLCNMLHEQERYNELLETATAASRVDPLEESYYAYTFRALYALKMYRAIIPAYNKTVRIFAEELNVQPSEEIRNIYAAAAEQVDSIEQDIMIIKNDLREVVGENEPVSGPLYCTYDVFKYMYQMVARSSERAGGSVVIVLLTLRGKDGASLPSKALSTAMNQVKSLILGGVLRKSDTVARYSKSQYIIMLTVEKTGSAEMVTQRIEKKCEALLEANNMAIVFATTDLDHVG